MMGGLNDGAAFVMNACKYISNHRATLKKMGK